MGNVEAASRDEEHAREFSDWPTAPQFVFFLVLGLMLNGIKAAAGMGAALLIRKPWPSAAAAITVGVVADVWPLLDVILAADPYILVTVSLSAAASLAWWGLGRGIRRAAVGRLPLPPADTLPEGA